MAKMVPVTNCLTLPSIDGGLHESDDVVADGAVAHEALGPRHQLRAVQAALPSRETEREPEPELLQCYVGIKKLGLRSRLQVQHALSHLPDEVVVEQEVVQAPREKVEELLGGPVHQPLAHLRMHAVSGRRCREYDALCVFWQTNRNGFTSHCEVL